MNKMELILLIERYADLKIRSARYGVAELSIYCNSEANKVFKRIKQIIAKGD